MTVQRWVCKTKTLLRKPLVLAGLAVGARIVKEWASYRREEIDKREFQLRTAEHIGAMTFSAAGAWAGGVAGSFVPIWGTAAGALYLGSLGDRYGASLARHATAKIVGTDSN